MIMNYDAIKMIEMIIVMFMTCAYNNILMYSFATKKLPILILFLN